MVLKDVIKEVAEILGLSIDYKNLANDENYSDLLVSARIRLNQFYGSSIDECTPIESHHKKMVLYGIAAEWAFLNGVFAVWKEYETKFNYELYLYKETGGK